MTMSISLSRAPLTKVMFSTNSIERVNKPHNFLSESLEICTEKSMNEMYAKSCTLFLKIDTAIGGIITL